METAKEFWKKWVEVESLERLDLLRRLPICGEGKYQTTPTLLNSYLEDLKDFLLDKLVGGNAHGNN